MSLAAVFADYSPDWPTQGQWTFEDAGRLPEDGRRYEIMNGTLYITHHLPLEHQTTVMELARRMGNHIVGRRLGHIFTAPFAVRLPSVTCLVQPDISFISAEQEAALDIGQCHCPPDLVVEVLSPASYRTDQVVKFSAYEEAGIGEYWLVNPHAHTIQVYTLTQNIYRLRGEYTCFETVESAVLPDLLLPTHNLFDHDVEPIN